MNLLLYHENNVVDSDNFVSNGIVHVIDGVLLPLWVLSSLTDHVFENFDISTLFSLLVLTGIDLSYPAADPVTVAGPTNDAFDLLDPAVVEFLTTTPDDLIELTRILQYHVFSGTFPISIFFDDFVENGGQVEVSVATLERGTVFVSIASQLLFNQASAASAKEMANNGVLFRIFQGLDPYDGGLR